MAILPPGRAHTPDLIVLALQLGSDFVIGRTTALEARFEAVVAVVARVTPVSPRETGVICSALDRTWRAGRKTLIFDSSFSGEQEREERGGR